MAYAEHKFSSIREFVGDADFTMDFDTKYGKVVEAIGIRALIPAMPASKDVIRQALANGDHSLNSIPLKLWDAKHDYVKYCMMKLSIAYIALADTCCILKHAAKMWAEQE